MARTRRQFLVGTAAAVAGGMALGGAGRDAGAVEAGPAPGAQPPAGAAADRPGAGAAGTGSAGAGSAGASSSLLAKNPLQPQPAAFDRLDEAWHRAAVRRLQARLQEERIDGILLSDPWNIIYFSGLWFTSTERPFHLYIPGTGADLVWFHPSLDRDLVGSWWIREREVYFDFKHGDGAFPDRGRVQMGATVDLTRWVLKGLRRRGLAGKVLGIDGPITTDFADAVADTLPGTGVRKAGGLCERLRMVKTREEIALTQRAMDYFSRIHAFARDTLLARGTDATDFEIGMSAMEYGVDLIMKDIRRDGRPHTAVGIAVDIGVRTGAGTAYPHPNQFHHNRIRKGDALQIAGVVKIGGYGGELYRAYQIAPWDAYREKVWDVHTECCRIQAEESAAGVTCSYVAKRVHDHQVKHGMGGHVYHRPAHGEGSEGHQPPYVALGDHTMLEEGMTFSNEPGLYVPEQGFGYNHSDNVLVTRERGVPMGSVPATKEWCFLKL